MMEYLRGILKEKSPGWAVVEVGGMGYRVDLSLFSYEALPPPGEEIKLYTYLHLKKDNGINLYGFCQLEERALFYLLISVSSIGPKSALRILSRATPDGFKQAIEKADLDALTHIPGIGKKTAQRLILELREKVGGEVGFIAEEGSLLKDTLLALVSLGYTRAQAARAVEKVRYLADENKKLAELIKEALRYI